MSVLFIKINHFHAFFDIIYAVKLKKKRFQKTATWVPSVISINESVIISSQSVKQIFFNPAHKFQKHGFQKNAFKVWKHNRNLYSRLKLNLQYQDHHQSYLKDAKNVNKKNRFFENFTQVDPLKAYIIKKLGMPSNFLLVKITFLKNCQQALRQSDAVIRTEKNSSSNFTHLSIKVGTYGQVTRYLISL